MRTVKYNRRGIALIWVAILSIMLFGFFALAIDTMWVMLVNHQLQNAADAAALAGARLVRQDEPQARLEAQAYANLNTGGTNADGSWATVQVDLNTGNDPLGDIVVGRYLATANPQFTPTTTNPNAVLVRAPRVDGSLGGSQPLLFGYHFDGASITHADIKRHAIARAAGGLGAGLLVLDPVGSQALWLSGGPDLAVIDGTIHVNSNSSTAVRVDGNYMMTGEELNIVGSMSNPPTTITVNTGMPILPDPLEWLEAPDVNASGMNIYPSITNSEGNTKDFVAPGYFPNGIKQTGGTMNFTPGTYIIGDPMLSANQNEGFNVNGGTVNAVGCTFYIAAGAVKLRTATIRISPPPLDEGWYYEHISIFQSRTNNSEADIRGDNNSEIEGTLYFPGLPNNTPPTGPQVELGGGGFGQGVQVIAYRLKLVGDANLMLYFDGWWPGPLHSRVYLVE